MPDITDDLKALRLAVQGCEQAGFNLETNAIIRRVVDECERLQKDAARLDALEREANAPGGLLLHSEIGSTGRRGLGLVGGARTLRQAVDSMMGAMQEQPR